MITADWHCQRLVWSNLTKIRGDSLFACQELLRAAAEQDVVAVFALGDLLNTVVNPSWPPAALDRVVRGLCDTGAQVYHVQGNHDFASPPWLEGSPAVHLHEKSVEIDGLVVYGLDYLDPGPLAEALKWVPAGAHVLAAHQGWHEWMHGRGQAAVADVPHVMAVWSGDLHDTRMDHFGPRAALAVSPGSLNRQAVDEPDAHFVLVYDTDKGEPNDPVAYERVLLRERPIIRVDASASTPDELDAFVAGLPRLVQECHKANCELPDDVREPLVRLLYPSDASDLVARCEKVIAQGAFPAHVFAKPVAPPRVKAAKAARAKGPCEPEDVLREELADDPEALELALSLHGAGEEYKLALDRWCERPAP